MTTGKRAIWKRGGLAACAAALLWGGLTAFGASAALAAEKVTIAIISFSPYAPWYIVQEKGLANNVDLDVRIIEDITAKNAGLTSGKVHCMLNTLD